MARRHRVPGDLGEIRLVDVGGHKQRDERVTEVMGSRLELRQLARGLPDVPAEPIGHLRLATGHGQLQIIPEPAGTSGYADLRRRTTRQPIGQGIRPPVAAPGDLARMLEALGRPGDLPTLHALHRIIELDRGRVLER